MCVSLMAILSRPAALAAYRVRAHSGAGGRALWVVHVRHQLLQQIARLRLALQVVQEQGRDFAERLLEREALARARGDLLAAVGKVLLERLGVTRKLGAQLVDLTAQIAR